MFPSISLFDAPSMRIYNLYYIVFNDIVNIAFVYRQCKK